MKPRLQTALTIAACLAAGACSNPANGVHAPSGSQLQVVVTSPSPANPGTLIVREHDYSYTPIGASPSGYQTYNGDAPIEIAIGTTVEMFDTSKKPVSSDPQVLKPVGRSLKAPDNGDLVPFDALRAGTATINVPGFCPSINTLPCVQPFSVTFKIS